MAHAHASGLREELERLALGGKGWPTILGRLAAEAERRTWLIAVHGGVLACSDGSVVPLAASLPASGVPASDSTAGGLDTVAVARLLREGEPSTVTTVDGVAVRALPLVAGHRRLGLIAMEEPVDDDRFAMLRAAILPMAIEAVRRDAAAAATAESASRLVDELRYGPLRDPDAVLRSAERFGLHLDKPHAAVVFSYQGRHRETWATAVRWIEAPVRQSGELAWTVLSGDMPAELRRIRRRLEGIVGDAPVLAATGPLAEDLHGTARSFAHAEVVLALLAEEPESRELTFEALGATGLLLDLPPARLADFVERWLGPILDREELLSTLAAWYEQNGSRAAVADRLHVHRNSVGYRIGRVHELLDADPLEPWTALQLRCALEAQRVLTALARLGRG